MIALLMRVVGFIHMLGQKFARENSRYSSSCLRLGGVLSSQNRNIHCKIFNVSEKKVNYFNFKPVSGNSFYMQNVFKW